MQLIIKNKWISLDGSSLIKDEHDNDVCRLRGKIVSMTRKKFLYRKANLLKKRPYIL